ncbi:MAG: trehalose-phosphatase [Pseudomonadota bacterium]
MMQLAAHEAAAVHAVPLPVSSWCLFLDVDGTLLELAASPTAVVVEPELLDLLTRLRIAAGGALALVSGRTLVDLDRLFGALHLPSAGLHGGERRSASGETYVADVVHAQLGEVREGLREIVSRHRGLLLEDKGAGLALHFQGARELEHQLRAEVALLAAPLVPTYALLDGHCVIEVKPAAYSKDSAVGAFMREVPFTGRTPIFIGDDLTDCGGFEAVRREGGLAIAVGPRVTSEWWLPGPTAVHRWLEQLAEHR